MLQEQVTLVKVHLDKHDVLCNVKITEIKDHQNSSLKGQQMELDYLDGMIKKLNMQIEDLSNFQKISSKGTEHQQPVK